jgi:HD-like signal output (HDOD) protein
MYTTANDFDTMVAKGLGQLPPFSPILNKLLASIASEDVRFSDLSGLIEKDTVLSGNVLRLVNSAAYARRGEINSVPHAVSVLGLNKLRNTLLGLSISRMWSGVKTPKEWSHSRFNLHSVGTAVMADHLAQVVPVNYPEGAFVAGLFHDFGKMLIATVRPAEFREVMELHALGGRSLPDCEMEILGGDHSRVSSMALERWNLPAPICTAVAYHHAPLSNPAYEAEKEGAQYHLSELLAAADQAVNAAGVSMNPNAIPSAEPPETAIVAMAGPEEGPRIFAAFQKEFDSVRQFF